MDICATLASAGAPPGLWPGHGVAGSARVRGKNRGIDSEHRQRQSVLAVNLGLGANIFLAVLKTTIGVVGHSPALLADGINSTSDVAYYVVVRVFMRLAHAAG